MNKTGWLTLVICGLLVITMSTTSFAKSSDTYSAKVLADNLNVRSEPSGKASVVGKLNSGEIVAVSKEEHGWLKVSGSSSGWVAGYYLKQVANSSGSSKGGGTVKTASVSSSSSVSASKTVSVGVNSLRLRGGPGTSYSVVTGAVRGDLLDVLDSKSGWMKVKNSAGEVGWVDGQYVAAASGAKRLSSAGKSSGGGLKGKRITVDPGHGGTDAGTIGTTYKTQEKVINLKTALYLADELRSRGAEVVMTRTKDEKPSLAARVEQSRRAGSHAFISVHYNSSPKKVSGTLTFYYSEKRDLPLVRAIETQLAGQKIGLKSNGVSFGDYHVLRENSAPAALVELGFLTNAHDEELARSSTYQKRAAQAIADGIAKYFQ